MDIKPRKAGKKSKIIRKPEGNTKTGVNAIKKIDIRSAGQSTDDWPALLNIQYCLSAPHMVQIPFSHICKSCSLYLQRIHVCLCSVPL